MDGVEAEDILAKTPESSPARGSAPPPAAGGPLRQASNPWSNGTAPATPKALPAQISSKPSQTSSGTAAASKTLPTPSPSLPQKSSKVLTPIERPVPEGPQAQAQRWYSEGLEANRNGDVAGARELFLAAHAVAPTDAVASSQIEQRCRPREPIQMTRESSSRKIRCRGLLLNCFSRVWSAALPPIRGEHAPQAR